MEENISYGLNISLKFKHKAGKFSLLLTELGLKLSYLLYGWRTPTYNLWSLECYIHSTNLHFLKLSSYQFKNAKVDYLNTIYLIWLGPCFFSSKIILGNLPI